MYLHRHSTVHDDHTVLRRIFSLWRRQQNITVVLPNMFQSFLKQDPNVNPHYGAIKGESEDWIAEQVELISSEKAHITNTLYT